MGWAGWIVALLLALILLYTYKPEIFAGIPGIPGMNHTINSINNTNITRATQDTGLPWLTENNVSTFIKCTSDNVCFRIYGETKSYCNVSDGHCYIYS